MVGLFHPEHTSLTGSCRDGLGGAGLRPLQRSAFPKGMANLHQALSFLMESEMRLQEVGVFLNCCGERGFREVR